MLARTLLDGMFDDASLFPPAAAPLEAVLGLHEASGSAPWGLARGRLLLPLGALERLPHERRLLGLDGALDLGLVVGSPADPTVTVPLSQVTEAVGRLAAADPAVTVRHVEYRSGDQTPDGVAAAAGATSTLADELDLATSHVELAAEDADTMAALVRVLARHHARDERIRAKLRFGGLTADLFPDDEVVLAFLRATHDHELPFKGTAGLHHAWYDAGPDPHHGWIAIVLAVLALRSGRSDDDVAALLTRTAPEGLRLEDDRLALPGLEAGVDDVARAREHFLGFGTCSFTEPLAAFLSLPGAPTTPTDHDETEDHR